MLHETQWKPESAPVAQEQTEEQSEDAGGKASYEILACIELVSECEQA